MKNHIVLLALFLTPFFIKAQNEAEGIQFFQGSWKEAVKKAKSENKPIFVDAYAVWCGPCKWMARNIFTDPEVASFYNENFINVQLNMEKDEGLLFSRTYRVNAYPTLLYFDSDGKPVQREMGAKMKDHFINIGKQVLKKVSG